MFWIENLELFREVSRFGIFSPKGLAKKNLFHQILNAQFRIDKAKILIILFDCLL